MISEADTRFSRRAARVCEAARRRAVSTAGYTLTELIIVMAILGVVLASLTTIFVSGSRAELDLSNRFQAQQNARLALDKLRREIHCASTVTGAGTLITIELGKFCPTNPYKAIGDPEKSSFTWCVKDKDGNAPPTAGGPYTLWRYEGANTCGAPAASRQWADHVIASSVFGTPTQTTGKLKTLPVTLIVDLTPADTKQRYRLVDDIVLRNSGRT